MKLYKIY